jgi:hypothetical protein
MSREKIDNAKNNKNGNKMKMAIGFKVIDKNGGK